MHADRSEDTAYDRVCDQDWDGVVDVSWQPGLVRSAVTALAGRTGTWVYVSSCSVYAAHDTIGANESASLLPALVSSPALETAVGAWATGRRGSHPATEDGRVLVPDSPDLATQVIDVRDLASWLVHCIEGSVRGTFNACGPMTRFADHLDAARRVSSHAGPRSPSPTSGLPSTGLVCRGPRLGGRPRPWSATSGWPVVSRRTPADRGCQRLAEATAGAGPVLWWTALLKYPFIWEEKGSPSGCRSMGA